MEFDDLQNLPGAGTNAEEGSSVEPAYPPGAIAPSAVNELVADLLETTGLVSPDRLAGVRSAAVGGSVAQAIVDEGELAAKLDLLYRDRAKLDELGGRCLEFGRGFGWGGICRQFVELLDRL